MSIATTITRLRELALELPRPGFDWEERPQFYPPISPDSVLELERLANFGFPVELKNFLEQTGAIVAMSVHNGYWIGGVKQLIEGGNMPRIAEGEAAIPVATDGGGNAFLLAASGRICRWEHETDRMKIIFASFGDFLERVAEDWAAYISEKPEWRFLV